MAEAPAFTAQHRAEPPCVACFTDPLATALHMHSMNAPLAPQALETGDFGYRGDLLVVHGITEAGEPL